MLSKILVPLDRSSLAEQAIAQAGSIARGAHAAVDVVLVHEPFPFAGYVDLPWTTDDSTAEQMYVEAIADEIKSGANVPATCAVMRGAPAEMICQRADDVAADLIIMTSHGRTGFSRTWLGSVADAVMRHAVVPVLMLRPEQAVGHRGVVEKTLRRILVPFDGSALATEILPVAVDLARATHATITLLRVVPIVPVILPYDPTMAISYLPLIPDAPATKRLVEEATEQVEAVSRQLHEESDVPVDAHVIVGEHVAKSIAEFIEARMIDIVAMSTHGRGSSRLVLGSVADKVLRASRVPVLLRRPVNVAATPIVLHPVEVESQLPALAWGSPVTI